MNRSIVRAFTTQITPLPTLKADFTEKTVIITGANVGLGLAAARHFVRLNAAKVILACRSVENGEKAKAEIEAGEGKLGVVEVWQVDAGSFASIKEFCARANTLPRLDAFIANAGLTTHTYQAFEGYERQVMVHVIAPFLMALLLLPVLRTTVTDFQTVPHVSIVSSNGHFYSKFAPPSTEPVFEFIRGDHDMRDRYFDSKLMAVLAIRELAKRLKASVKPSVILNLVEPGYCQSELLRTKEYDLPIRAIMAVTEKVIARTSEMGARTYVMAAIAGPDSHGVYLEDCGLSTPSPFVETEEGKALQIKIYDELIAIVEQVQPSITKNI